MWAPRMRAVPSSTSNLYPEYVSATRRHEYQVGVCRAGSRSRSLALEFTATHVVVLRGGNLCGGGGQRHGERDFPADGSSQLHWNRQGHRISRSQRTPIESGLVIGKLF